MTNQPQKQGKSGKMGRKRANWEENGKLAGSLPLRTGRAGYGPDHTASTPLEDKADFSFKGSETL